MTAMSDKRFWQKLAMTTLITLTLAASTACAGTRGRLYVRVAPPRPVVEAAVVSPGPGYVWVPGYHRWDGRAYVWTPGAWMRAPRPRAAWVPGHWAEDRRRGWYFVDGRWR
jgi:hypothetical protein